MCLSLRFVSAALFVTIFVLATNLVSAQTYPTKPVRIIVPFGAGGPGDTYTRLLAQRLSDR